MRAATQKAASLGLAVLLGSVVVAAPALALAADPVYEVQLWVDDTPGRSLLLANVTIPDDVVLPTSVVIPLPEDADVVWAGEIRGPDSSMDVERSFVETEVAGGRAIELTVSESRVAQYEAAYRETEVEDETRISTMEWTQSVPAEALWVAVQLPPGAEEVAIDPPTTGETLENELGQTLHVYEPIEPLPGETIQVRAEYVQGEAPGIDASGEGTDSRTTLLIGLVLLAGVGVALVVFLVRRSGDGGDEDFLRDDGSDDEPEDDRAPRKAAADVDPDDDERADDEAAHGEESEDDFAFDLDDAWGDEDE
jgi:hypothetical protein